jgi:ectoine hydroxylase-related dioxygenase (phytanoyl-CoA dioxygenase family)
MISGDWVAELKQEIQSKLDPDNQMAPGATKVHNCYVEESPSMQKLMDYRPYMELFEAMLGTKDITLNRSAAILKRPGCEFGAWHTDWAPFNPASTTPDSYLNSGEWPSGFWFYLNGTHPARGGLALIEDSHLPDWPGPEGFELTERRKSFYRKGTPPHAYADYDVPGLIPLYTDPGDLIIFATRTYHGVFKHNGNENRLSCAVGFRAKSDKVNAPWPLPESAKKFVESAPARWKPMLEEYTGIMRNFDPYAKK